VDRNLALQTSTATGKMEKGREDDRHKIGRVSDEEDGRTRNQANERGCRISIASSRLSLDSPLRESDRGKEVR
jgi:hypothetical protein